MDEQLRLRIEQAATSMLSDAEICVSLGIDQNTLDQYYDTVERSRVLLKQKLNARRIADAATANADTAQRLVETIPRSNRGGARPGAGRKAGTTNKISGVSILASVEHYTGERFEDLLAQGYADSINHNDKSTRLAYEKMFLNKVVADRVEMGIGESESAIAAKQAAFEAALAKLAEKSNNAK